MTKLLINEPTLIVLPGLAMVVGLNEALLLQQAHYWLLNEKPGVDGLPWFNKTYEEWNETFPFFSIDTVKRAIRSLEEKGYLVSTSRKSRFKMDRTKSYTVDYSKFPDRANLHDHEGNLPSPSGQNATMSSGQFALSNITRFKNNKEEESNTPIVQIYTFAEFYEDYPNKKNRPAAEKAWLRIFRILTPPENDEFQKIIRDGLARAKDSAEWARDDGQFIPHPATWLNNWGWENEYTPRGNDNGKTERPYSAVDRVRAATGGDSGADDRRPAGIIIDHGPPVVEAD